MRQEPAGVEFFQRYAAAAVGKEVHLTVLRNGQDHAMMSPSRSVELEPMSSRSLCRIRLKGRGLSKYHDGCPATQVSSTRTSGGSRPTMSARNCGASLPILWPS